MRRLLIVSPHFPPSNAPDLQRVRASLPHYREFGWEPTVLAVRPEETTAPLDPELAEALPKDVPIVRTDAAPLERSRRFGMSTLGLRAKKHIRESGAELLARDRFDLVFFSTTQFAVMDVGPGWKRKSGVPYVLDYQDARTTDYYARRGIRPPGGPVKYAISQALAARLEPRTVREAAHLICVSRTLAARLRQRYGRRATAACTILPFGASEDDAVWASAHAGGPLPFDPGDGLRHWIYIGAAGDVMRRALTLLFQSLAAERAADPPAWERVRLHFIGTSYAPPDRARESVAPLAREIGLGDLVVESPARLPHFDAIRALQRASAILLPGTDEPAYAPSKFASCLHARRPMLALVHERSPVHQWMSESGAGESVQFGAHLCDEEVVRTLRGALRRLRDLPISFVPQLSDTVLQRFSARENARRQCAIFDRVFSS